MLCTPRGRGSCLSFAEEVAARGKRAALTPFAPRKSCYTLSKSLQWQKLCLNHLVIAGAWCLCVSTTRKLSLLLIPRTLRESRCSTLQSGHMNATTTVVDTNHGCIPENKTRSPYSSPLYLTTFGIGSSKLLLIRGSVALGSDRKIQKRFPSWNYERPTWGLVQAVSRQTQVETERVLYSTRNTFHMTNDYWEAKGGNIDKPLIRRYDCAFDMSEMQRYLRRSVGR